MRDIIDAKAVPKEYQECIKKVLESRLLNVRPTIVQPKEYESFIDSNMSMDIGNLKDYIKAGIEVYMFDNEADVRDFNGYKMKLSKLISQKGRAEQNIEKNGEDEITLANRT